MRVTVTDLASNSAIGLSNSFEIADISTPHVDVISPKNLDKWKAGESTLVTWESDSDSCDPNSIATISLSIDGGATFPINLAADIPDSGSYQITVPDNSSTHAVILVTISRSFGNSGEDSSDEFTIQETENPDVAIIAPNGGDVLNIGDPYTVQWTATDSSGIDYVNIDFSPDGGQSWSPLVSHWDDPNSYEWTPWVPTNNGRLRITAYDIFGNSMSDLSDGSFSISGDPGSIFYVTLDDPNGGEYLVSGNSKLIEWTVVGGGSGDVTTLEYSVENGIDGSWKSITTVSGAVTSYVWTIPCDKSDVARVKVTVIHGVETRSDISDSTFKIAQPQSTVQVNLPNGGEILWGGSAYSIRWIANNYCGINSVSLYFSSDNGSSWQLLADNIDNDGTYQWNVPSMITIQGKIRITAHITGGSDVSDDSNNPFEIQNADPVVILISPNGGEQWETGSQQDITWTATDSDGTIDHIKIEYSTNTGLTWNMIVSDTDNTGTFSWIVPTPVTNQAKVRVTAYDNVGNSGYDQSNSVFRIINGVPEVTVLFPNEGTFYTQDSMDISWSAEDPDGIKSIDISYSINDNPFTFLIALGIDNSGSYPWTIPNIPSENVRIIITAHDNAGGVMKDQSDPPFSIVDNINPTIYIQEPNGGERWKGNLGSDPKKIEWTASDNVNVVRIKLEYSINSGINWHDIIDDLSNNGYYYWFVPLKDSTNCKIKATAYDAAGNSELAISSGEFEIYTE